MSNLSKLLSRSGMLAQQGDLNGARSELEKAIRDHGNRAEPWISLAAIYGMGGNYHEALHCARKAVEIAPASLQGWINLAGAAQATGNLSVAAEAMQRACGLPGCPQQMALNLGLTLTKLGRWSDAERPLREYLSRNPADREATLTLSSVLTKSGKTDEAIAITEEYRRSHVGDIDALLQLGNIYRESGRMEDAWRICNQALLEFPGNPDLSFFKVDLLENEGLLSEAIDILEQLERVLPKDARVLSYLSVIYRGLSKPDAAIAYARAALELDPQQVSAILHLGSLLMGRDHIEARHLLEQAEALAPHDLSVQVHKGKMLEFEGNKQGAWECVKPIIERGIHDLIAVDVAASVAPALGRVEEAIALLEQVVRQSGLSIKGQRSLRFALAKLCDKAKLHDRAFEHAIIANQLKNAFFNCNIQKMRCERLVSVYSEGAITSLPRSSNHSQLPIFIVGMPRSGTSLLEQILSCHSQVHARGETTDVRILAESIAYYPDGVRNLTQEKCDTLANTYLQRLRDMAPTASRVTDKMPGNYMNIGLISQIFPGARIINCRRDPRDICLSNFMIEFAAAHPYAYDLESLALTCKDYQELMTHWRRVVPIPILDVRYEDLVADPQTWVAKVLEFCGLEWEDACLNFHKSERLVATASYDQVKKPLYKSSVARWKPYEKHLEPVSRILGLQGEGYP